MSQSPLFREASGGGEQVASPGRTVSVGALAWLLAAGVFVALRIGTALEAPVGGAELVHLSGAWQARIGVDDVRYVPTLFQALSAFILHFSNSELPSRLLAVAASATIPFALYRLRGRFGESGALLSLLFLAFDPLGILNSGTASAMAFDLPVALWLFVLSASRLPTDRRLAAAGAASAGFAVAVCGPLVLVLAAAWLGFRLARGRAAAGLGWPVTGFMVGVALTSLLAGEVGVAPFALFSASFQQAWSGPAAADLVMLYGLPFLIPGLVAVGFGLRDFLRRRQDWELLLVAWGGIAGAWLVISLSNHSYAALLALTTPLALTLGPAADRALRAVRRADWSVARFVIPVAGLLVALALAVMLDWARADTWGSGFEQARVAYFLVGATVALAALWLRPKARPVLLVPFAMAAALLILPTSFGMAVQADAEPLPSPFSPAVARELRNRAIAARGANGGPIVIHDSLRQATTWPFRDSGPIVFASRIPEGAAIVIWPTDLPAPQGLFPLEGNFALTRQLHTPTNDPLDYLLWLLQRNTLAIRPGSVAVYTRAGP